MIKISIIIAMYNIEGYIGECLDSCIHQEGISQDDYEIVIVNDGSTDKSCAVASKKLDGIRNARIITQKNEGLSSARNTGLKYATGAYVWFVDGDDKIANNAICVLKESIDRYKCDAFIINYSSFRDDKIIETSSFQGFEKPISGKEIHHKYLRILPQMAWLSIYRLEFVRNNSLLFLEGIIHEDFEYSIRAHHLAESIFFISESLYCYRIFRKDSIMGSIKQNNLRSLNSSLNILNSLESFFISINELKTPFCKYVLGTETYSFFQKLLSTSSEDAQVTMLYNKSKNIYRLLWNSTRMKHKFFLVMLLCLPKCITSKVVSFELNRH